MGGQRFKLDLKQFQDGLAKFQKHRDLYNLHLEEFEREMQKAAAGRDKLESHCSRFSDHVEKFHVPGARPPHICLDLQTQERDLQQMNARYLEGQRRLSEAESQLASSEAALKAAAAERAKIGERLQKQAAVERVERTYGTMLLKEYEQLKLEWKILAGQKKDLGQ